jgi:hypothetical protein
MPRERKPCKFVLVMNIMCRHLQWLGCLPNEARSVTMMGAFTTNDEGCVFIIADKARARGNISKYWCNVRLRSRRRYEDHQIERGLDWAF